MIKYIVYYFETIFQNRRMPSLNIKQTFRKSNEYFKWDPHDQIWISNRNDNNIFWSMFSYLTTITSYIISHIRCTCLENKTLEAVSEEIEIAAL